MQKTKQPIITYFDQFLEYLDIEKGLSPSSQQTYARLLGRFVQWLKSQHYQSLRPHELTNEHLWQYRVYLASRLNAKTGQPIKRSMQNYYLIALRNFLKFFAEKDIQALPAEKIKLQKDKKERVVKFLKVDEKLRRFLTAPDTRTLTGKRDRAILECLYSTGMRVAELTALNRDQIKLTPQTNHLEIVIVGKGDRPRPVYFSQRAIKALRAYLSARKDTEKALFIRFSGPKTGSRRLSPRSIENIVKKYAIQTGLPVFTSPHTLRHTFATALLNQGVDLRTVQEFLGHKNVATTQIYTHVTSRRLREVHKRFHGGQELNQKDEIDKETS